MLPLSATAMGLVPLRNQDTQFLYAASQANESEIATAKLVEQRTANAAALTFAHLMIADHSANETMLQALAKRRGAHLPTAVPGDEQAEIARLSGMSGRPLAHSYLAYEVGDHQKVIDMFRHELSTTSSNAIRSYVQQSLPVLEKHLRMAKAGTSGT